MSRPRVKFRRGRCHSNVATYRNIPVCASESQRGQRVHASASELLLRAQVMFWTWPLHHQVGTSKRTADIAFASESSFACASEL